VVTFYREGGGSVWVLSTVCLLAQRERERERERETCVCVRASQGRSVERFWRRLHAVNTRKKEMRGSPSSPPFINSFSS
jgi:hypothetical protein